MHYRHLGRKYNRDNTVATPSPLADKLCHIIQPVLQPKVVLDPCVGRGNLIYPWREHAITLGCDVNAYAPPWVDHFMHYPFDAFTTWSRAKPDLVICNPPFNDAGEGKKIMWPEIFLRTIVKLFGRTQPIFMLVPHGFRLNLYRQSKRRLWMQEHGPEITSFASLPIDAFPNVKFHVEGLAFNIPGLKTHYWL